MTDFTRLITSLKRRSAHVKEFGDDITFIKLEDLDALVEALEKAQGMEAYWKTQCRGITDHCEELQVRIAELESSGIASGILRCTECSFVQTKNIISITPDAIVIGNSKPEPCPNGCGPLQPVTWKALAIQLMFTTKQGGSELLEAKKRIAELEESHAQVIQSRDHYKRISEEGLKQLAEPRTFIVKLPHQAGFDDPQTAYDAIEECKAAIAAAGVTGIMWEVE
ncbi:TPA: hypothetical protein ACIJO6_001536 [Klebsiella aerogenes]